MHRTSRVLAAVLAVAGLPIVAGATERPAAEPATVATSAAPWADADAATIHPGVRVWTPVGQCTTNFVYTDGTDVLIGMAAHCTTQGGPADVDGCATPSLGVGTSVDVDGADHPGVVVYDSWQTMKAVGETATDACTFNDFALVRLDPRDHAKVNPSVPFWGGPTGVGTAEAIERIYLYGNTFVRLGLANEMTGVVTGGAGWWRRLYSVGPGLPGDSGAGVLSQRGEACCVLSHLEGAPRTGSNRAGNLPMLLEYARTHVPELADLSLAAGTEPFDPAI